MKRGSALLIVLGMISFMVVSAVAFSAYMRTSRLPSSYLRRTSSSRQLVKAALAEAIDQIDIAIGNDPFPGMGDNGTAYASPRADTENVRADQAKRNYWRNHCFIGTNRLVAADETVSTLTLEALAYLPPALINEARYYSRHSAAARWQTMGFDVGRYAFFAVDVSDHLDVNRIAANVGRNSSDNGRVSLAYAFENAAHTGYTVEPSAWDAFMEHFVDAVNANDRGGYTMVRNASKLPLVSLADLNLAIGYGGGQYGCPSQVVSPFCRYLHSNGSQDFVVDVQNAESRMMRALPLVTDSYLPASTSVRSDYESDYDLNDPDKQPFRTAELRASSPPPLGSVLNYRSDGATRLRDRLCDLSLCALWDYLDEDSVPLSLAIPTTERVPMFAAVQPKLEGSQLTVTYNGGSDSYEPSEPYPDTVLRRTATRTETYSIDPAFASGFLDGEVKTVVTFPFRRDGSVNGRFTLGGRVALFFSDPGMTFHTGNADDVLHIGGTADLVNPTVQNGVFYAPLQNQTLTFPDVETEDDAVREVTFQFAPTTPSAIAGWLRDNPMFTVTREWVQTRTRDSEGNLGPWLPADPDPADEGTFKAAVCNVPPLTANGVVNGEYAIPQNFLRLVSGNGGVSVKLQMCVWLYATEEGTGKYVDLVPACIKDDDDLNRRNNYSSMSPSANAVGGMPYPLLRFGGRTFDYKPREITTTAVGLDFGFGTPSIMCADPRWNWAPEHWFEMPGGLSKQNWLDNCQRGNNGGDRDIFMATSDAGYLQSIYELAFLPRLTDLRGPGADATGVRGDMATLAGSATTQFAADFARTVNNAFAWQTYRPFALKAGQKPDGDEDMGFECVGFTSEGVGFRVNPYADSDAPVLAALANTPYNWRVASTNTTAPKAVSLSDRKAETFNDNYCFNERGEDSSAFAWDDIQQIAEKIRTAARSRGDGDWRAAFDGLDWGGVDNADNFAGVALSGATCDLSDADRKFLYGYWRDCFAARQQLFLVFVRAEPTMMGGGAVGQTPPQLGARAVALVWRDPAKTQTDVGASQPRPHRTRVLFYRQFE